MKGSSASIPWAAPDEAAVKERDNVCRRYLWFFFMFTALQPVLRQRMLEGMRTRKIAQLEKQRSLAAPTPPPALLARRTQPVRAKGTVQLGTTSKCTSALGSPPLRPAGVSGGPRAVRRTRSWPRRRDEVGDSKMHDRGRAPKCAKKRPFVAVFGSTRRQALS